MSNLVTVRNTLATALSGAGRVVYAYPREAITPPAIVLVPGSPYIDPQTIGTLGGRYEVKFDLTVIVGATDNQAALANLESMIFTVMANLPAHTAVESWSQPSIEEVSGNQMLTSRCTVTLATSGN